MISALFFTVIRYIRMAHLDYSIVRFARSVLGDNMCRDMNIDWLFKYAVEVKTDEYHEI